MPEGGIANALLSSSIFLVLRLFPFFFLSLALAPLALLNMLKFYILIPDARQKMNRFLSRPSLTHMTHSS